MLGARASRAELNMTVFQALGLVTRLWCRHSRAIAFSSFARTSSAARFSS